MGKKSKSDPQGDPWLDELRRQSTEKAWHIGIEFVETLRTAIESGGGSFESYRRTVRLFFQLLAEQLRSPYKFEPFHKKIRHPIDYYQFSLDFIRPLVDEKRSHVEGLDVVDEIEKQRKVHRRASASA